MIVRTKKPDGIDDLTLYEIQRVFRSKSYCDLPESINIKDFIASIENGTINMRKYDFFNDAYISSTLLKTIHLDSFDKEKIRVNLIKYMKQNKLFQDKTIFTTLSIKNKDYWVVVNVELYWGMKFIKDNIEHYLFKRGSESGCSYYEVKYPGCKCMNTIPSYKRYDNEIHSNYCTWSSGSSLDSYRKIILRLETIYYFTVLNVMEIYLNQDTVFHAKQKVIDDLLYKLRYHI